MLDNTFQDAICLLVFVEPLVVLIMRLLLHQPVIKFDILFHYVLLLFQPQIGLALPSNAHFIAYFFEIRDVFHLGHVLLSEVSEAFDVEFDKLWKSFSLLSFLHIALNLVIDFVRG